MLTSSLGFQLISPPKKKAGAIDTVKLLCECVQLEAPQDLRHALFVLSAFAVCESSIKDHLRQVRKTCLVAVHPEDFRRIEVTFANGVCAQLRVHECYPQVRKEYLR